MTHNGPTSRLRVGVACVASVPGDLHANAETAAAVVDDASELGVQLLVFSELFLPGYHPPTLETAPRDCDLVPGQADPRLTPLLESVVRTGVTVLVGASVREGDHRYISTVLVGDDGEARGVYRKQNLCGAHERRLFTPGTHGTSMEIGGWRLGLGICYDAAFPEHARSAARDDCHAYVTGGAFDSDHRRSTYHAARALDNTFYVVFANALGGAEPWTFSGGSAVYDPEGREIAGAGDSSLAVADLDPGELHRTRRDHTMLADVPREPSPRFFAEL